MNQDSLITAMISDRLEEYPATEQRYLEGCNVDVYSVFVPCPRADTVGYDGRKGTIEVENEEKRAFTVSSGRAPNNTRHLQETTQKYLNQEDPVEAALRAQRQRDQISGHVWSSWNSSVVGSWCH